jgi:hypothetical protein
VFELLFGLGELIVGFALGLVWERKGGWPYPAGTGAGVAVCVALVVHAATTVNPCPAGSDCDPTTAADWTLLGVGASAFWLLAVAMGYAVSSTLTLGRTG